MNNNDFRYVLSYIRDCCRCALKIKLIYNTNTNTLKINDEYCEIKVFEKISMSNMSKLLSKFKNDNDYNYYTYICDLNCEIIF